MRLVCVLMTCLAIFPAFGQWQLQPDFSELTFMTIKNHKIAENHRFKQFSGQFSNNKVSLTINLSSVDTNIAIRDQRMKEHLFSVTNYPEATFTAKLDNKRISEIKQGQSKRLKITGNINLHGMSQSIDTEVLVAKLSKNSIQVTSLQPLLIRAEDFALVAGINKLQQLAGLDSIAYSVPLSFSLTFTQG